VTTLSGDALQPISNSTRSESYHVVLESLLEFQQARLTEIHLRAVKFRQTRSAQRFAHYEPRTPALGQPPRASSRRSLLSVQSRSRCLLGPAVEHLEALAVTPSAVPNTFHATFQVPRNPFRIRSLSAGFDSYRSAAVYNCSRHPLRDLHSSDYHPSTIPSS